MNKTMLEYTLIRSTGEVEYYYSKKDPAGYMQSWVIKDPATVDVSIYPDDDCFPKLPGAIQIDGSAGYLVPAILRYGHVTAVCPCLDICPESMREIGILLGCLYIGYPDELHEQTYHWIDGMENGVSIRLEQTPESPSCT